MPAAEGCAVGPDDAGPGAVVVAMTRLGTSVPLRYTIVVVPCPEGQQCPSCGWRYNPDTVTIPLPTCNFRGCSQTPRDPTVPRSDPVNRPRTCGRPACPSKT